MLARFISIFILLFLLLSPVFRYLRLVFEEPLIIIAEDNSESVKEAKIAALPVNILKDLPGQLDVDYKIKTFSFGEKLSESSNLDFSEKETNFDPLFEEIEKNYANYNIGALVIGSDGIYNKGINPVYSSKNLPFPVYSVALGDTAAQKDIIVKNVYSNKIAFTGDLFPVEVLVDAFGFRGKNVNLNVYNQKQEVKSIPVEIKQNDFSSLLKFELKAEKSGLQTYIFRIEPQEGEFNIKNNSQDLVIDINNNKKKVLILSYAVHPDIGAIQEALASNKNLSVEAYQVDQFNKPINEYQLVILHQLPTMQFNMQKTVEILIKNQMPVLFIWGQNTNYQAFNSYTDGIEIKRSKNMFEQALPVFNQGFKLFETDVEFGKFINECQPLNVPFADIQVSGDVNVLFFQRLKGITTNYPLVAFKRSNSNEQLKYGVIFGEGIWRWRLKDYLIYENHELFDDFMNKIVKYLAIDLQRERFMIKSSRFFKENEDVEIRAEFYNESYESINSPDIDVVIINDQNKEFNYQFSKSGGEYTLNAGKLPVGHYRFNATTTFENQKFQKSGEFIVMPVNIEQLDLVSKYNILNQLSGQTGGKMYRADQLETLANDLNSNENIKKISHSVTDLVSFIEMKWIFFLISFILGLEWFIRKYFGSY